MNVRRDGAGWQEAEERGSRAEGEAGVLGAPWRSCVKSRRNADGSLAPRSAVLSVRASSLLRSEAPEAGGAAAARERLRRM